MSEASFTPVATLADIPAGKTLCVTLADREILLCHTPEGIFAVDNSCTHAAARMSDGKLKGCRVICPMHGAAFDVRDGAALSLPARTPLATYPVRVEGDAVMLGEPL